MYSFTSIEYLRSICFSLAPTPLLLSTLLPAVSSASAVSVTILLRRGRVHHNTQPEPRPGPFSTAQNKN